MHLEKSVMLWTEFVSGWDPVADSCEHSYEVSIKGEPIDYQFLKDFAPYS
jgi:hypothetical protein